MLKSQAMLLMCTKIDKDINMRQAKLMGLVLLIIGAFLLYFGFNQANSTFGELGEAITGKYSDETMAYLIGGVIAAFLGLFMLLRK